jgi:hypothetical protein
LLRITLPLSYVRLVGGVTVREETQHYLWLLADQDCDLAWRALTGVSDPFLVELRPVYTEDPPDDWGIRSQLLRLDETGSYLRANSPNVRVSPEVVASSEHVGCLDADSQLRLKTWFGMRYDRPAIPQRYTLLARAIAGQIGKKKNRVQGGRVRDVLAQFSETPEGLTEYSLVAVLPDEAYRTDDRIGMGIRTWLSEIVLDVPRELGTAVLLEAYSDHEVSLAYVEGSFSLDLSKLSWPQNAPGPNGAV